jgi:DNA-binding transcriptional LysR family regulator
MDERQLRVIRAVHDRGGVSAAAETLRLTPGAVSQHLAALQREFPIPLTARQGRRLVLTEAGIRLSMAGIRVSEAMALAKMSVSEFINDESGTVSLSAFHSAALNWFPALVAALNEPGAPTLKFSDEDVSELDAPGLTGDHDLVVAHRLPHERSWPTDRISVTALLTEPIDVALAADHPLATHNELPLDELARSEWIAAPTGFALERALGVLAAAAANPLNIVHQVNRLSIVAALVRSTTTVALMPRYTSGPLPGVVLRPIARFPLVRQIDMLSRPEVALRASVPRVGRELLGIAARSKSSSPRA